VAVRVKHRLTREFTGVESESEVAGGVFGGDFAAKLHEVD
jgi:hypothetical protein